MSYFTEVKIVDKITGNAAQVNPSNQLEVAVGSLAAGISSNSRTQLNITRFDSSGNEAPLASPADPNHNRIVGCTYVAGNSGIDAATETLQIIDFEHHAVHAGTRFMLSGYALNQVDTATVEFVITTPNTIKWAHLLFSFSATEGATLEIYEGANGVTGGTPVTPINNNRNSVVISDLIIVKDPVSITSAGTLLASFFTGQSIIGGLINRGQELILKQNTAYLIRITSVATSASNNISWSGEWYEHTNKN